MDTHSSSSPRKLLLVLPEVFNCAGGIQMFCRALCLAAGDWAHQSGALVSALVLNDSLAPDPRYVNGNFTSYLGAGKNKTKFVSQFLRHIISNRYDWIIFGHVSLSPLAQVARLFNPRAKTGVVAYGNEVWQPLTRIRRWVMREVDVVLAISDHTKDELVRHSDVPAEKVKILPCALDPHWDLGFSTGNFESKPPLILTVARMTKEDTHKGIDSVIKSLPAVMNQVGPIEYRVVGAGDDVPRLQSLAAELGIAKNVLFMGGLEDAELREHYRRCSLFVLPSGQEGFGIVFLEAMAYGKPIIGGLHGGTPFVVKDRETGWLVGWSNVEEIAQAIIMFLRDGDLRQKFGHAGYHRLIGEFTFDKFAQKFNQILLEFS
jgi:glycosyltransferase involved in cell wall biosynthesis